MTGNAGFVDYDNSVDLTNYRYSVKISNTGNSKKILQIIEILQKNSYSNGEKQFFYFFVWVKNLVNAALLNSFLIRIFLYIYCQLQQRSYIGASNEIIRAYLCLTKCAVVKSICGFNRKLHLLQQKAICLDRIVLYVCACRNRKTNTWRAQQLPTKRHFW